MNGCVCRQTYGWSGGLGETREGGEATGSFQRVGGPLDWGSRGLGNVESHSCNWAAIETFLGVSRRSYRPGYSP